LKVTAGTGGNVTLGAVGDTASLKSLDVTGADLSFTSISTKGAADTNGGNVTLTAAATKSITVTGTIDTSGGTASATGKNAGMVTISAGNNVAVRAITARGSAGAAGSDGGAGGSVSLTATAGTISLNGTVSTQGGDATGGGKGGDAATILVNSKATLGGATALVSQARR
jgi:filamentous hemagglutinin